MTSHHFLRSLVRLLSWLLLRGWLLLVGMALGGFLVGCSLPGSASSPAPTSTPASTAAKGNGSAPGSASGSVPVPQIDMLREGAINSAAPSIVRIENVGQGLGSGVILTKDGYIVTNNHVVQGGNQFKVTLADGRTFSATIRGADPVDDLAVVKINAGNLPAATLGNSSALQVGQTVLALGNPLGITHTVTDGIISALNRTVQEGQNTNASIPNAVQTSAPINPGNSGGALINLAGQIVGIPTLAAIDPEFNGPAAGIGFAIPSNTVRRITSQLISQGKVTHSGRAALGIYATSVSPQLASYYNLPVNHGVLVARLTSGGAAAKAGMKPGDVITGMNGKPIQSESDLLDTLAKESPGDRVTVTATTQSGQQRTFHLTLGELQVGASG